MKYFFLILSLILFSCSNSEKEKEIDRIVGTCPSPNPAKPSKSEILFDAQGGIDSVTTAGWLSHGSYNNCKFFHNDYDYCEENYCQTDDKGLIISPGYAVQKIQCKWFIVTQTDRTTIHVLVNQNETGEERKHYVAMSAGNCGSGFWIIQSAE
jgi:hypothetical protein